MKKWDLWDTVMSIVANNEGKTPQDVLDKAITFLSIQMSWDLLRIVKEQESNKAVCYLKKKKSSNFRMLLKS